jgi:hypothetical protein
MVLLLQEELLLSLYSVVHGADLGSTDAAVNGLYGDGRFGYSVNEASDTVAAGAFTLHLQLGLK